MHAFELLQWAHAQIPAVASSGVDFLSSADLGLTGVLLVFVWQQRKDNKELQGELLRLMKSLVSHQTGGSNGGD